jgi:hypothetical protein
VTTTVSEQSTTVRETLPPVECTPWCEVGDGHTAERFPEDQRCTAETREVFLSRRPLVDMGEGKRQQDSVCVYLGRENNERAADEADGLPAGPRLPP